MAPYAPARHLTGRLGSKNSLTKDHPVPSPPCVYDLADQQPYEVRFRAKSKRASERSRFLAKNSDGLSNDKTSLCLFVSDPFFICSTIRLTLGKKKVKGFIT